MPFAIDAYNEACEGCLYTLTTVTVQYVSLTRIYPRGGAVVRALASHQCGPGSILAQYLWYMWVEFVVGSRPCFEGFSPGSPVFLPP